MNNPELNIGILNISKDVNDLVGSDVPFTIEVARALKRYRNNDWGLITNTNMLNLNTEHARKQCGVMIAFYNTSRNEICITTNYAHDITVISFPDELKEVD